MRIRGEDRNGGKASANVVKWPGAKTAKEVISYAGGRVLSFRAQSSIATLECSFQMANESGV